MAIKESSFDNEAELESWVFANITSFLGECVTLGKFQIETVSGKKGIPDGFAFNFATSEWYIIECELLHHGVWPHIAEQVSRFVVASSNPETQRKIRDRLFEHILGNGLVDSVAATLEVGIDRLLQQIELFIEGVQPSIAIFIDDTNEDLKEFAEALVIGTEIYRVKKFIVNGTADYYSPDEQAPVIVTTPGQKAGKGSQDFDVVEKLGGGSLLTGQGKVKCYKLENGSIVNIKRSKFHEKGNYYWYGIGPSSLEQMKTLGASHIVFVMGDWGFATVPMQTVEEFCKHTKSTKNSDGSIRHYHVVISQEPEPEMYWSNDVPKYDLTEYSQPFD